MTRVVVVSDLWPPFPGGAERYCFNVSRHLMRAGHDVRVLTGYDPALQFDGPPVTVIDPGVRENHAHGAKVLMHAIDQLAPDVLLVHHFYAMEFERELTDQPVPLVQIVENGHRLPTAKLAVYISEHIRRECGDAQPQDLVMLPPAFADDPEIVAPERLWNAIGFIKPIAHKGVDLFYEIAGALPRRQFLVLRHEWHTIEHIEGHRNVTFLPPVARMADFWAQVRLVLVPSLVEDAGTVAQEATVNGVPCISSDVGGLPETNPGGVLLPPVGVRRWVAAIQRFDNPARYDLVVERQRRMLDHYGHVRRLDQLSAQIELIGAGA